MSLWDDIKKSAEDIKKSAEDLKKTAEDKMGFFRLMNEAQELLNAGDFRQVLSKLKEAQKLKPDIDGHYSFQYCSAVAKLAINKAEPALRHFNNCIALKPEIPNHYYFCGLIYFIGGKYDQALVSYQQAQKLQYEGADLFYWKGICYQYLKNHEEALREFLKCHNKSLGKNDIYRFELAATHLAEGDVDDALELQGDFKSSKFPPFAALAMQAAMDKNNSSLVEQTIGGIDTRWRSSRFQQLLGEFELSRGAYTTALQAYQQCGKKAENLAAKVKQAVGKHFQIDFGTDENTAERACEEAFVGPDMQRRYIALLNCEEERVQEGLADVYAAQKDYDRAIQQYGKLAAHGNIYFKVCLILIFKGQYNAAMELATKTATASESSSLSWQLLVLNYSAVELGMATKINLPDPETLSPKDLSDEMAAFYYLTYGKIQLSRKAYGNAIEDLLRAKNLVREKLSPHSLFGHLLYLVDNSIEQAYQLEEMPVEPERATSGFLTINSELYSILNKSYQLFQRNFYHDLVSRISTAQQEYDRPLLIVVAGEFNAGKSTFINAIIGQDVVPSGIAPTTATINILKYGPEPKLRIVFKDGNSIEDEINQLAGYTDQNTAKDKILEKIDVVEILYPNNILQNINIVDTPGFNSEYEEHDRISNSYLRYSDAIIWLFNAQQAGKLTEVETLAPLAKYRRKAIAIVNQIDTVRKKEDLKYLMTSVKEKFDKFFASIESMSAYQALEAKLQNDSALLNKSRYSLIENFLNLHLFSDQKNIKFQSTLNKMTILFNEMNERVANDFQQLETTLNSFQNLSGMVGGFRDFLENTAIPEQVQDVDNTFKAVYRECAAKLHEFITPAKGWLDVNTLMNEDRYYLKKLVLRRVSQVLSEQIQQNLLVKVQSIGKDINGKIENILSEAKLLASQDLVIFHGGLQKAKEEMLIDRVVGHNYKYFQGYMDAGTLNYIFEEVRSNFNAYDISAIQELFSNNLADLKSDIEKDLREWSKEYFEMIYGSIERLQHHIEKKELDIKKGLLQPFRQLAIQLDNLHSKKMNMAG